ncbi:MAG: DegT/DnrJ/EryC1/StrS aminotransferase family protein [Alphaproteobacteria bacterium]|nr:DegT/DnrJ/EryC1/StrS aminotransferase family protein [Alphaproteobacteria bacterium]
MESWPHYDDEQIAAAVDVLRSGKVNYWTGAQCQAFEREFAQTCHAEYGIALANGTLALELALHVLDIGSGDEVVVTPRSFFATASCVLACGATPVFADVDPVTQNITAETIGSVLTSRTKAVIPVHLAGWPCDMAPIMQLAGDHDLWVIEDCAQAHGASIDGRPVGAYGHLAAFSFCQDKIITTAGEGGMLVTNDRDFWKRGWSYKDHGKSYDAVHAQDHPPGFRWLHDGVGSNWRMTELQAAIGRVQLRRLQEWTAKRRHFAAMLSDAFANIPAFRVTTPPADVTHAYYRYYVMVRPEALDGGWDRDRIMQAVAENGTPCFSGSCPEIYLERAFDRHPGRPEERLPVAKELGETSLAFLVHPTLTDDDMQRTIDTVSGVMARASRKPAA